MNHTSIMVVIKHYILIYLNILKFYVFKQKYLKLIFFYNLIVKSCIIYIKPYIHVYYTTSKLVVCYKFIFFIFKILLLFFFISVKYYNL